MKYIIIALVTLVTLCHAGLNDPVEFRGTVMGAIVEKFENGEIVLCATQIRSKKYALSEQFYVVLSELPKGTRAFIGEYYKCTGVLTNQTREIHPGWRPYPVFKYVAP